MTNAAHPISARAMDVKDVTSPSGIKAWLVEDHSVPVISIEFAFRGGAALDPDGKPGVASFVANMLDEGAGDLNSEQFQQRLEDKVISLDFQADRDDFRGSLKTLSVNQNEAFHLTHLALAAPRFDNAALSRVRAQLQSELKDMMADPIWAAYRISNQELMRGHPYANPAKGTLKSLAKISKGDLKHFVQNRLGLNRLEVAVSGDITAEQLAPVLDQIFKGLQPKTKDFDVADITELPKGKTFVVRRELPQTRLVILQQALKRQDKDWPVLSLVNYILGGGGFNSRLMLEVREKRGLTYGVSTSVGNYDHVDFFAAIASTANDKAKLAVDLIKAEWQRMADGGVTDDELKDAKTFLTGALPLALTSTDKIATFLLQTKLDHLPINYDQIRLAQIDAVTKDDIARVAKSLLKAGDLNVIAVGKPAGFDDAVEMPDPALAD